MSPEAVAEPAPSHRRIAALIVPALKECDPAERDALLLELAEVLRAFGSPVSIVPPDGVLLDVSGVGHLHGGEEMLASELLVRARELGHPAFHRGAQLALSSGPRIAQAVARMGLLDARGLRIVPPGQEAEALSALPLAAFLGVESAAWFARLGLVEVSQLLAVPPSTLSARLGPEAPRLLTLLRGIDTEPLVPCEFPREIEAKVEWDDAIVGLEPLFFTLRGLVSRVSARLRGRGEAASVLELVLHHDPAVSRYRNALPSATLRFELGAPIHRDVDLERVLRARLERLTLPAPTVALALRASSLVPQTSVQLELGSRGASHRPEDLPVLLAELETDVGAENVGLLNQEDAHAPEGRTRLVPFGSSPSRPPPTDPLASATRLFSAPVPLGVPLRVGESFVLGSGYYTVEKLTFAERLDAVSWWTERATSRDYVWAWLSGSAGGLSALCFVDRRTGRAFVQGLAD